MRVAVCLSGLVRTYRETYQNFLANLVEPNRDHQIDVFISTWPTEHSNNSMERTRRLSWYGDGAPPFPENALDYHDLQEKYRPQVLHVEAPKEFVVPWYIPTPGLHIQSIMCMMYKIYAADLLRRQHEQTLGFTYDVVVRCRFDTLLPFPIKFDENFDLGVVTTPSMMQPRWHPDYDWVNDKFACGNARVMSLYSDWFTNLDNLVVNKKVPIQPEILLHQHLLDVGVQTAPWGSEMELVRLG